MNPKDILINDLARRYLGTIFSEASSESPYEHAPLGKLADFLGMVEVGFVSGALPQLEEIPIGVVELLERQGQRSDLQTYCRSKGRP